MLLSETSDVINKLTVQCFPVTVQIFIFASSMFTSVKLVLIEFPLKRGGLIGHPLQTDRWSGEWTPALISSCGRDFLCYLKSGSVLKQSSSRLTQQARVCGAFASVSVSRGLWERGKEVLRAAWAGEDLAGFIMAVIQSWLFSHEGV